MLAGQTLGEVSVERLCKARISNRAREPLRRQHIRGLERFLQTCAIGQNGNRAALANHAAFADLERRWIVRQGDAGAFATRISKRARAIINLVRRRDHMREFGFV